jgi:hypothetical protein
MPTPQEQSIFRILAYMAYAKFPLTAFEVWKWCDDEAITLHDVMTTLADSMWLREHGMQESEGFFALGDAATWRQERLARTTDALRKSRRAAWFVRWASLLPWVRMIAVCNSLAQSFTNEESDIDLFVVTKPGRLWSTRLVLTGALALLRLRPHEAKRDPICLSFFIDTEHVDLAPVKIGADDPYLLMWTATLAPVLDRDDVMSTLRATNRWIRPALPKSHRVRRSSAYALVGRFALPDIGIVESFAERLQRARFPQALRENMNRDTRVVVTSGMLKFHENDRREAIRDAQSALCNAAGL